MDFFLRRSEKTPKIYGYTELTPAHEGLIKIGYTTRTVLERMKEHFPTAGPVGLKKYKILLEESSMRDDGTSFQDVGSGGVHQILESAGFEKVGGEWFRCSVDDVKAAIVAARNRTVIESSRNQDFSLRPEQKKAIQVTKNYFTNYTSIEHKSPHFLWNCKMRFGKTFTAYKLAQEMNWSKILVLTFKPAVESSWKEDLLSHIDFSDWQFVSQFALNYTDIDDKKPFVCFASFQDFLGKNKHGGIKIKNEWAHTINWDCIILDEYHYGAWRDTAKELYSSEDATEQKSSETPQIENWDEDISPLKTNHYLYLSGTPFRAVESGEFIEEQIYNWTYLDEQEAKDQWNGSNNPYESLPRMVMMTYQLPESASQVLATGEYDEFSLNEFFKAEENEGTVTFKYEDQVQQWLNLIRGSGFHNIYTNLKLGSNKPVLPFADARLLNILNHTFWFLPSVASCHAMKNLMMRNINSFYQDYEIIVCAGPEAGIGLNALPPVLRKMSDPLHSKTITLSCGKLTTGVTVKPWTGVFMLRDTSAPETYFQTAFRVQSPWTINIENSPNKEEILKHECYVFDFAPNRALRLLTDYSCRLSLANNHPESQVEEFIKFLPVLCFDGTSMRQINSEEVLNIASVGTSGSQLARKFESPRLVHVDNITLMKLMQNSDAMNALMKIEAFRNLNSDIDKIINQTDKINDLKEKSTEKNLTPKQSKSLSESEKETKNLRKQMQQKLQKFATRIPVFMYLTDYREQTLLDVITKLEPDLFRKVTGLSVQDFELLLSLGLFNATLMNSAIFSFKRYENSSLHYSGITKHDPAYVGLFDTTLTIEEFNSIPLP
tara:strand:+ start:2357 stop:4852 length:2496 start_codon:yes stop_codon:yes gene_type:complete